MKKFMTILWVVLLATTLGTVVRAGSIMYEPQKVLKALLLTLLFGAGLESVVKAGSIHPTRMKLSFPARKNSL